MRKKNVGLTLLMVLFCSYMVHAQSIHDIRINEVLVYNENSCMDNYGVRSGWFEVYNTGYKTINIGGWYITNDINNNIKYRIPKSDPATVLTPGAHILFYAYGESARSACHVNFTLADFDCLHNGMAYLALYDQSGKVLVDSVSYSLAEQKADVSFGKLETEKQGDWAYLDVPTPKALNAITSGESRSDAFGRKDPHGIIITITCMAVVFLILFLVSVVFKFTGKYFQKQKAKQEKAPVKAEAAPAKAEEVKPIAGNDDEVAAIAMALHMYFNDMHEVEATGFCLRRGLNQHSAWEGKSMMFRKSPIQK